MISLINTTSIHNLGGINAKDNPIKSFNNDKPEHLIHDETPEFNLLRCREVRKITLHSLVFAEKIYWLVYSMFTVNKAKNR